MESYFFSEVIQLASNLSYGSPGEYADRERVKKVEEGVIREVERFTMHALEIPIADRITLLELTTRKLIDSYYLVRSTMKSLNNKERDKARPTTNAIHLAITNILACAKRDLKIGYSAEFIQSYKSRGDTFFADSLPEYTEVHEEAPEQKTTKRVEDKNFEDYLINCDRDAVMAKLRELMQGKAGKYVAMVMEALQNKKYLMPNQRLGPTIIREFNLSTSTSSINNYLGKNVYSIEDEALIDEIAKMIP